MIDQYIPCPVCRTQIPIDLHLLIQGVVSEAVDNFEKLKKMAPQKK